MQMAENNESSSETNDKVLPVLINRVQSWFTNWVVLGSNPVAVTFLFML